MPLSSQEAEFFVSVILHAGKDTDMLDRAVSSVLQQTFADWELLVFGDGSVDGIREDMRPWTRQDRRIRVMDFVTDSRIGEPRNAVMSQARGEFVTHLDAGDEYYPDYIEQVARCRDKTDVLVFGYDVVYQDGAMVERAAKRGPRAGGNVFSMNPIAPLGVSHRRAIVERVGGFNNLLWQHEDSDLWQRLERAEVRLVFIPLKSGRHYVSLARAD
ncbi:MAG: glycosyltransferase [Thermoguttaceae bacterium]|jgi:glycosyltransferase involved in cell wall biosynthesis